ncbi:hypothetical protein ASPZODRAFT_980102 [Penicilliopsis zonata CBS 506.65]|uniref:Uncharacterized protein n=1 Tax=Penicilliopsis zonata CBS 506.65 TaxID=1073090 RepID=A0A1L9SR13_9EURO|nr:hypothetical protein ASPZODRAFT_980102 [Penicilliopsis zonata CBS 506.65]OJJ49598.1 hypothetical protein ASPZODRAFT_980102 [Penicilliopsis zonata CBS 506.65]
MAVFLPTYQFSTAYPTYHWKWTDTSHWTHKRQASSATMAILIFRSRSLGGSFFFLSLFGFPEMFPSGLMYHENVPFL